MLTDESEQLPIEQYCWRQLYRAGGRREGFKFAIEVNCDLDMLKKKLEEENEFLFDERRGTGGLSPGASPRLVAEGFVSALIELIGVMQRKNKLGDAGASAAGYMDGIPM